MLAAGHELVGIGNRHRAEQKRDVDDGLVHQHLVAVIVGVDEGFEQMDRRDTDDRRGQLDLQHAGVDVA